MTPHIPVIIGPRVVLRGPEPRDVPDLRRLRNEAEAEAVWQRLATDPNPHHWVIEADGGCVGTAKLRVRKETDRRARFTVCILSPPHIGRGFGTETTRLVLAYAFEVLRLHRVEARVLAVNRRGLACFRSCGFVQEGRERESTLIDGEWHDCVVMGVLEHEYRRLSAPWPKLAAVRQGSGA
jgi:RimJ/RimL family protein N-acetyltransferase